jgi:uncharacterized membrane protein
VFHQLLHWHYLYDGAIAVGLVSDGLFHAFGSVSIVAGLFLLADSLRRGTFVPKRWRAALLIGWGGFQLYDGIVQHKLLGLHQIRYHVLLWPYDLTWNVIAAPPMISSHDEIFGVHAGQHLLLGMAAPALLALFAPVTLAHAAPAPRGRSSA